MEKASTGLWHIGRASYYSFLGVSSLEMILEDSHRYVFWVFSFELLFLEQNPPESFLIRQAYLGHWERT